MKDAEANDVYRRISESRQAWKNHVTNITIGSYEGIQNLSVDFTVCVNAFVGSNGSGKTRILSALYLALSDATSVPDVSVRLSASFTGLPRATLINAAEKVEIYRSYFKKIDDIEENLLNGIEAFDVSSVELSGIKYILCRNYTSVKFYETEPSLRILSLEEGEAVFSADVVPFFSVCDGTNEWDSRSMGSGEYAALYIWWALRNCKDGEIVLIEEPETYLSYVVQERMANHLTKCAWEKKLSLTIATHSYPFIAKLPEESIKPLLRKGSGTSLASRGKHDILASIGAPVALKALCVVEDKLAKFLLESFIEKFFPAVASKVAVSFMAGANPKPKAGASGVSHLLEISRHISNIPIAVIGVFDGDQINQATFLAEGLADSLKGLLPGSEPIDVVFTNICRTRIEETFLIHEGFPVAFEQHEGSDFHDHLRKTCSDVGVRLEDAWRFCFARWAEEEQAAVEELRGTLSRLFAAARVV